MGTAGSVGPVHGAETQDLVLSLGVRWGGICRWSGTCPRASRQTRGGGWSRGCRSPQQHLSLASGDCTMGPCPAPGYHVAHTAPLRAGDASRRAPRAPRDNVAALRPPFGFLLINSPASLISPDEMCPREYWPPALPFGALITLPAGGGKCGARSDTHRRAGGHTHAHKLVSTCAHACTGMHTCAHLQSRP